MAFFIGAFIGGFLIIWLIALLVYRIAATDNPKIPVFVAWLIAGAVATMGFMDGGQWSPIPALYYLPSAFAVYAYMQWRENKASESENLDDVFK